VSLKERLTTLLQDFDEITDRELRGDLLIDYATRFTPVSDTIAKRPYPAAHKVPGCESEVYAWVTRAPDGTVQCHFAVENPQGISAKALAAILQEIVNNSHHNELSALDPDLVDKIFGAALSMGKGQGLRSMVGMVKHLTNRHTKS
jgi:cysteine desulfuration protein SufE